MNKYARLVLLIVLVGLCLACAGAMHLWRYECLPWECVPDRSFPVEALLIDESAFPQGWETSAEGPRPPPNAPLDHYDSIERTMLTFYVEGGGAGQQVHRFASVRGAIREYKRLLPLDFSSGKYDTPWVVPAELPYQSLVADQFHFACSNQGGIPMCAALGRYEEYIIRFTTHLSPDFMTYADLERVLQAIDERMALYLAEDSE